MVRKNYENTILLMRMKTLYLPIIHKIVPSIVVTTLSFFMEIKLKDAGKLKFLGVNVDHKRGAIVLLVGAR